MSTHGRISQLRTVLLEKIQPTSMYFYINFVIRLAVQVWRQLIHHKCLQQASSLAFTTLICLVPLSAVALFLLQKLGVIEDFVVYICNNFLPGYQADEIASGISGFAKEAQGSLGAGGLLLLLLISTALFSSVEKIFNDIWDTRRRLSFFQKYAVFYTITTVGTLLMWFSISVSTNWLFKYLLPWLFMYAALLLIYNALPNTVVQWKSALVGALIAGTFFQNARVIFGYYLANIVGKNYSMIYGGALAIPILAVWIYIVWVIILLGAEITHAVQHLKHSRFRQIGEGLITPNVNDDKIVFMNSILVIRLFLTVAEHFYKGEGAYPKSQIILKYGLSGDLMNRIFTQFREEGLIYEVEGNTNGYIPARALSDITLDQVISAFEGNIDGLTQNSDAFSEATEQFLDQVRTAPQEIARSRSIEELVASTELTKIYRAEKRDDKTVGM